MTAPLLGRIGSRLDTRRGRLITCLALYGGSLGAAAFLVSLLARTKFPKEPEHLEFIPSIILSSGGIVVGAVMAGVLTYMVAPHPDRGRHLLLWLVVGFAFGVLLPFFTGAFIPLTTVLLNLTLGVISPGEVFSQLLGSILRAPAFAFTNGTFGLFTGMLAGALFGFGAWLIDTVNALRHQRLSNYGSYAIAVALSLGVVLIASFGNPQTLAKLG